MSYYIVYSETGVIVAKFSFRNYLRDFIANNTSVTYCKFSTIN